MRAGCKNDPSMFSCMDKNSPESDSVLGLMEDSKANKSLRSA